MNDLQIESVPISEIDVSARFRRDMGDIAALAKSINDIGLLQPIGVDSANRLVFGGRRIAAYQSLGRESIPARILALDDILQGEFAENEIRKDFTVSERVAIARAIEERLVLRHGGDRKTDQGGNFSTLIEPGKSRDLAAEKSGFGSGKTYEAAKKAVEELPAPLVEALDDGRMSIHMAAAVADLPEEVREEIASAPAEQVREAAKEAIHNHRAQGTGENEWYTPQEFIDSVRAVMGGIDLDPASSDIAQQRVQAARFFTQADDGLSQAWEGRVFLNPPYAQPAIQQFVEKIVHEVDVGNVSEAVVLTHNYTDTRWFHRAASACDAICFTRGRIGFLSPEGKKAAPTQGQAFFYFGPNVERFCEVFEAHGFVVAPA